MCDTHDAAAAVVIAQSALAGGDEPGLQVLPCSPSGVGSAAAGRRGLRIIEVEVGQQRRQAGLPFELLFLPLPRKLLSMLPDDVTHTWMDTWMDEWVDR